MSPRFRILVSQGNDMSEKFDIRPLNDSLILGWRIMKRLFIIASGLSKTDETVCENDIMAVIKMNVKLCSKIW